jgi:hypothetical protein
MMKGRKIKIKVLLFVAVIIVVMGFVRKHQKNPFKDPQSSEMKTVQNLFFQINWIPYEDEGTTTDHWKPPLETISTGAGDCEDKAFLLHYLLTEKGILSKVIFGYMADPRTGQWSGHAWNEVAIDGEVWLVDATNGVFGRKEQGFQMYMEPKMPPRALKFFKARLSEYLLRLKQSDKDAPFPLCEAGDIDFNTAKMYKELTE